jgi:hypothetical protein
MGILPTQPVIFVTFQQLLIKVNAEALGVFTLLMEWDII